MIAAVERGRPVTWQASGYEPADALWLHEEEFWAIAAEVPFLRNVSFYEQSRHHESSCRQLIRELDAARTKTEDLRTTALIEDLFGLVSRVLESGQQLELMIEGP